MKHPSKLALVVWIAFSAFPCLAQELRLTVINADTGRPINGKEVEITRMEPDPADQQGSVDATQAHPSLTLKTGKDGTAKFELIRFGGSPPKLLLVSLAVGDWAQCSPFYVPIDQALRSGVVMENRCPSDASKSQAYTVEPGQIIVFTRQIKPAEKRKQSSK